MTSLLREGAVFMQRLEFFRGLEDGIVGDPNDGLLAHYSGENPTLRV